MRALLVLITLLFSAKLLAADLNWFDLETRTEYKLQQNFQLQQLERSRSLIEFSKGEKFLLKEVVGLGMGLGLFNFHYSQCPGPALETDIEIIPVDGTPVEVGIMVAQGCELWVYVELKDFWTKSLFQ